MPVKVAINGYGRIGRNVLKALYESKRRNEIQIVAVNDLGDAKTNAHLTRYDTAHGPFPFKVDVEGDSLVVDGDRIRVCAERDPSKLPWKQLGVDVVMECTGLFTTKEKAGLHITAGAKKVVISAPAGKDVDATIVFGVNHKTLKASDRVISNASCTTNCLAPLAKVLHDNIGIVRGLMTTIHAYTNDQVLTDVYPQRPAARALRDAVDDPDENRRCRRGRPRAARARRQARRLRDARADDQRVARRPDVRSRAGDVGEGDRRSGSARPRTATLKGILRFTDEPLVSIDFNHNPASSVYDSIVDEGDRRQARESLRVVRQRVGLLESHARHDASPSRA